MAFCCVTLWCLESRFPYLLAVVALIMGAPVLLWHGRTQAAAGPITPCWRLLILVACYRSDWMQGQQKLLVLGR